MNPDVIKSKKYRSQAISKHNERQITELAKIRIEWKVTHTENNTLHTGG